VHRALVLHDDTAIAWETDVTEHRDESFIDKVKGALGMGSDDKHADHAHDHPAGSGAAEGHAPSHDGPADTINRPAGPDYGAADATGTDLGGGAGDEGMRGTAAGEAEAHEHTFGSSMEHPMTDAGGPDDSASRPAGSDASEADRRNEGI